MTGIKKPGIFIYTRKAGILGEEFYITPIPLDTSGFLPKLRTLVRQHDAPIYTITYYTHWLLQESIADHGYRISISGTAAAPSPPPKPPFEIPNNNTAGIATA